MQNRVPDYSELSELRFAFLSFRPFESDFRRYLMQALRSLGCSCVHVLLKRDAMTFYDGNSEMSVPLAGIGEVNARLRHFFGNGRGVIVNSAGNSAPDVVLRLWASLQRHVWVYDVFDHLLYAATGAKRLQWWATDRAYRSISECYCLLSPDLDVFYPNGFYLDNASHLQPSGRPKTFDGKVVVTASFDRRTDFNFLQELAERRPDIRIDLYGLIYDNEPTIVELIDRLVAQKNVRYHGSFQMDKIEEILEPHLIGLLPYRADDAMTRFINPDKLFHYLCAGLEVIATPIPATRRFKPYIHEAADAAAVVDAITRIERGDRRNPGRLHETCNWRVRAREFLDFVEPHVTPALRVEAR